MSIRGVWIICRSRFVVLWPLRTKWRSWQLKLKRWFTKKMRILLFQLEAKWKMLLIWFSQSKKWRNISTRHKNWSKRGPNSKKICLPFLKKRKGWTYLCLKRSTVPSTTHMNTEIFYCKRRWPIWTESVNFSAMTAKKQTRCTDTWKNVLPSTESNHQWWTP